MTQLTSVSVWLRQFRGLWQGYLLDGSRKRFLVCAEVFSIWLRSHQRRVGKALHKLCWRLPLSFDISHPLIALYLRWLLVSKVVRAKDFIFIASVGSSFEFWIPLHEHFYPCYQYFRRLLGQERLWQLSLFKFWRASYSLVLFGYYMGRIRLGSSFGWGGRGLRLG